MERRSETWDSFWAQLWRIDFFEGQWDMYHKVARARAEWLASEFSLDPARPLLSCACGEAGVELALAARGFAVSGIDKCSVFIHHAREQAGKANVEATFLTADLRESAPGGGRPLPGGNGCVMCCDTLGLLAVEDEAALVGRMIDALAPGGTLLIDTPRPEEQASGRMWWPLKGGYLLQDTRWDRASFTLSTEPLYVAPDGALIELRDPYDQSRGDHSGIQRHIYSADELVGLVGSFGLEPLAVPHHRKGYSMVVAVKP
jgi:2-polyprenyl-3-methyl-5-hydroxy-6-metoxy-1,4-benzoquinol methylase